ncbi:MAG TPA: hypothetical protein VKB56_08065 [Terriglobales bacterium]|nr:hypothetical protein [Terriglobales bacterium]
MSPVLIQTRFRGKNYGGGIAVVWHERCLLNAMQSASQGGTYTAVTRH